MHGYVLGSALEEKMQLFSPKDIQFLSFERIFWKSSLMERLRNAKCSRYVPSINPSIRFPLISVYSLPSHLPAVSAPCLFNRLPLCPFSGLSHPHQTRHLRSQGKTQPIFTVLLLEHALSNWVPRIPCALSSNALPSRHYVGLPTGLEWQPRSTIYA